MWPFRRREDTTTSNVPTEVEDYYRTERRERVGLAWLLAFGSLIATLLIALALFYGIRFIYHKVHHNKSSDTSQTTSQSGSSQSVQQGTTGSSSNSSSTSGQVNAPGTPTTNTPSSSSSSSTVSTNSTHLTNTGPGSTLAVFVVVSILGALVHNVYMRRKVSQKI